jgi:ribosomal protein L18E
MLRQIRKENPELRRILVELRKAARANAAPVWGAVAEQLNRPRHHQVPLNVGHLDRLAGPNEIVVVAGSVLASGNLTKPVVVGAHRFSPAAREKIHAAGGRALMLHELVHAHPDGRGVRLLA